MIKVSTTGMAVSLKTDLRFPESGQHGHGSRIIHFDFRGNIVDLLPDEFGYGFGTIFSQHDCFIRYGCGNKTSFTSKIISSIY